MTTATLDWKDRLSAFWQERKPLVKRRLPAYVITGLAIYTFTRFYAVPFVDSHSIDGHMVFITLEPAQPWFTLVKSATPKDYQRGELVFIKYAGKKLETHAPGDLWVKYLRGLPGDRIEVKGREVYLNGNLIGKAKTHTRRGTPLPVTLPGIIPPGYVFIAGISPDSFDSRYATVGLQPISAIHGRAKILF